MRNTDVLSWSHLASSLDAASGCSDVAAGPVGGGGGSGRVKYIHLIL